MSSAPTTVEDEPSGQRQVVSLSLSREHLVVGAIVVIQAMWLTFVMMRGWYSGADLPNLAYANGRALSWDYLTSTLGGHFGVAQRLLYWVLNNTVPLEWWLTVLFRVVMQALTTVLLWRLFRALVGTRPWLWIVLAGYASSAYLVAGLAMLNSGMGLSIAQACLVGALLAHVRYTRERRILDAAMVALLVLVMLAFSQQSSPALALLPILSVGFLHDGGPRDRLRAALSRWPGWLILGASLAVFAVLYLSGDYNSPADDFTLADAWWLAGQGWWTILGPALVGGPWQYFSTLSEWSAFSDPPLLAKILGQVVLVGLILISVRRTGSRALVAWLIPVWIAVASMVLVGSGRWWLEDVVPHVLRYSYFVPVAMALGVVLAFGGRAPEAPLGTRMATAGSDGRSLRVLTATGVSLLILASLISGFKFSQRFSENPSADYVGNAIADVKEAGPGVAVYDTLLPGHVVPFISQMYVSDLLGLGGVEADFTGQGGGRMILDDNGHLVPATFMRIADYQAPRQKGCGIYVRGVTTKRLRLGRVENAQSWFLQLQLYQPKSNSLSIRVLDDAGEELAVTSGSSNLDLTGELVVVDLRLALGIPEFIEIESTDPDTNLCLVHTYVGIPVS